MLSMVSRERLWLKLGSESEIFAGTQGERSVIGSNDRRQRLEELNIDYADYLQEYQGFFVIKCQMSHLELERYK